MLREVFYIKVSTEYKGENEVDWAPMVMGKVKTDKYPSADEIEHAIRLLSGNTAEIDKRYELI